MKKQAIMVIVIGAVLLLATAGCGSKEEIIPIHSSGVLDGEVQQLWWYFAGPSMPESGTNYCAAYDSPAIKIGITYSTSGGFPQPISMSKGTYRALLSFDLSHLAGKAVTKAILKVHFKTSAGDPVAIFENLVAEHVDYGTDTPTGGCPDHFHAKLFTPTFSGIMSAAGSDWWTVDVTSAVQIGRAHV